MRRRGALMTSSTGRVVELSVPDSLPLALRLYRLGCVFSSPLAFRLLTRRLKRGKEHPERMTERLGQASIARPAGPLVWVHGASVGEMLAVISLIERLRAQHFAVLVTSGTVTSAALAEQRLPDGVLHQFRSTRRALCSGFSTIGGRDWPCSWNPICGPISFAHARHAEFP